MIRMDIYLVLLSLPMILFIGIITSYQDIKKHLIKNKWILLSAGYSIILLISYIVFEYLSGRAINPLYFKDYFLNIFFALFGGFIIWIAGLWSAGDAKLFAAFTALVPLSVYNMGYVDGFPALNILINTFTPVFFYMLIVLMFKTSLKNKISVLKDLAKPRLLMENLLFIFAFVWIIELFIEFFSKYTMIVTNFFLILSFLFLLMFVLKNVLNLNLLGVSILISVIQLLFNYESIFTFAFLRYFFAMFFFFIFLRYFIINLGFHYYTKPIYIEDLKPGMYPLHNFIRTKKGNFRRTKIAPISFISGLVYASESGSLFKSIGEGLSRKEVKEVQRLHSEGYVKEHSIMVSNRICFAPFLFGGVILTLIFRGNILFFLKMLLENFI